MEKANDYPGYLKWWVPTWLSLFLLLA